LIPSFGAEPPSQRRELPGAAPMATPQSCGECGQQTS